MKFWLILGHISSIIIAYKIGIMGFVSGVIFGYIPGIMMMILAVGIIACSSFSWKLYDSTSKIKRIIGKIFIFLPVSIFLFYTLLYVVMFITW